jgi:polysaccharide export outer membrane protein
VTPTTSCHASHRQLFSGCGWSFWELARNQPITWGAWISRHQRHFRDGAGLVPGRVPVCVPASFIRLCVSVSGAALLAACVKMDVPLNDSAKLYDPEKSASTSRSRRRKLSYADNSCPPPGTPNYLESPQRKKSRIRAMPLMRYSPGDRVNILVFGSPEFSGDFAINVGGSVNLPFAGPIKAMGLTNGELAKNIRRRMTRRGLFTARAGQISVQPVEYAAINVTVAGAVFKPGRYTINETLDKNKLDIGKSKSGDNPMDRFIPAAAQAAGGVRPDADLSNITVYRKGKPVVLDWRGAIAGYPVDDMPLIEGDHVEVGEAGCFQSALVRPSQITPEGIRVFVSNLTAPSLSNANSTQNQDTSAGVPYGTRMLQGLVQANCVGGTYATNAKRIAVLISRNPKTRKTEVVQRSVEELVRRADRDAINPFLMPEDALACYDSSVTEFRDVMSVIYGALLPAQQLKF